jgi:hypothetical protein
MESSALPSEIRSDNVPTAEPKQNFALALSLGIVAALIGAIAWAVVTVTTGYQIGYMAIGVGFLVGFAMRLGRGRSRLFAYTGAILALLGCVLGNLLSIIGFYTKSQDIGIFSALTSIDYSKIPDVMTSTFDVMDLFFYAIAIYEGYRFSVVQASPAPVNNPPEVK